MNEQPPIIRIRVEEVLELVCFSLDRDDIDRATRWASLALSANDPADPMAQSEQHG